MTEPVTSRNDSLATSAAAPAKSPANQAAISVTPSPRSIVQPPVSTSTTSTQVAPTSGSSIILTQAAPEPSRTSRWLGIFSPYKIDIQQGNFISQEMASQLKEGMTKEQVKFLLGGPLLTDMFHDGRWDYLFRLQKGKGELTTNRLTVYFKDNRVIRFESTVLPGEVEYISHISGSQPAKETPKEAPKAPPETKPQPK